MATQTHFTFLEEWLRSNSGSNSNTISKKLSPSPARAIIQAWADLRDSLQKQSFQPHHLQSLKTLLNSQSSLYVADPQAKLLLSILSTPNTPLPLESYPLFLRLLYIWVRKSTRPSQELIDGSVKALSDLISTQFDATKDPSFSSELVILLGAISFSPSVSKKSKTICLESTCQLLELGYQIIGSSKQHIINVLSGIGYALASSEGVYFVKILDSLFGIWNREDEHCSGIFHGLMILHLTEWVLTTLLSSHSIERVNDFTREILETSKPHHALFATVMAAAGALRASNKSVTIDLRRLRNCAVNKIETVAANLISKTGGFTRSANNSENSLLLKCISLALTRTGPIPFRASLLICLASALLTEIFPLQPLYARALQYPSGNFGNSLLNEVREHLSSTPFKEAGAITGVFCNQYVSADEESKKLVENQIWKFCEDVYVGHRQVALVLRGREDELLSDLEKIAESAFLMVVVFALAVTKHKLNSKYSPQLQLEISVKILVSFSCLEYFRRMRLPEYMDTIRAVVGTIQENESACVTFVDSMPPYSDLTNQPGSSNLMEYSWSNDEVQTSRILFHLRVIPTSIERLPSTIFRKVVAPVMFLYLGHPNVKVARASHSLFVAFISSAKDIDESERILLKEQLVFYYIQRSLELYPGITSFEGMASGVAALVRHLPAGSPSIFYTIDCLVDKAHSLCGDMWTQESSKKIVDLLLRLLSLVDIQVLPNLMKQLAQLVSVLPRDFQNEVLDELYAQVAESDDVTRKPTLVSWLQSLSYLCSQSTTSKGKQYEGSGAFAKSDDSSSLSFNARL